MAASALDGMYYEFHIPLGLKDLVEDLLGRQPKNPNSPSVWVPSANRQWFSIPRANTNSTTEVLTINFKLPFSVSELAFQALRVSVHIEAWYLDRMNNWKQMRDNSSLPVALDLSSSAATSWFKYHTFVYPIVAKAIQLRLTRRPDTALGNRPYVVGIKETLIRRNIYDRAQGMQALESEQDPLGNTITKYIKDWNASKAIDNSPTSFWRSAPQPDPQAVVSLYLDVRDYTGSSQLVDKVFIDPVYVNQALNLYYSNDDTVRTMKLSPIALAPSQQINATWIAGQGLQDSTPPLLEDSETALYQFPVAWGPLISTDSWIGIAWAPAFDPTSGPAGNPVLFEVTPTNSSGTQWWPKILYDVGAAEIVLEMTNGTTTHTYSTAISPLFPVNQPLKIVVGWRYDTTDPTVYISVVNQIGVTLASYEATNSNFPPHITLDGEVDFSDWEGTLSAVVVKRESYQLSSALFQQNPAPYVNPDPVLPDINGNIPASSLDNAILAVDWTTQEFICGGTHETWFTDKEWTPVWRDYNTQKGFLILPHALPMKYLKLEFTHLTPEPYPVYDSDIKVTYNVFPVSVVQMSHGQPDWFGQVMGYLTLGLDMFSGVGAVNWMHPETVQNAMQSIFGATTTNVTVAVGTGIAGETLPNTTRSSLQSTTRDETSSPWVYRRAPIDTTTLAQNQYTTINGQATIQGNASTTDPSAQVISDSTGQINTAATSPGALPIRGQDWWVFPGQTLKMPASIMNGLTTSEVVTERYYYRETRIRFTTTSVHQYDTRTVTRDAAMAYFAGILDVQPYYTTHITDQDPINFTFSSYDPTQWVFTDVNKLDSGPITADSNPYVITNPHFEQTLADWTQTAGVWVWSGDGHQSGQKHLVPTGHSKAAASVVATGATKRLLSQPVAVTAGDTINFSGWLQYQSVTSSSGGKISIGAATYLGSTLVDANVDLGMQILNPSGSSTPHYGEYFVQVFNDFVVPAGVDHLAITFNVNNLVTAGTIFFSDPTMEPGTGITATAFKDFQTQSDFAKLDCEFFDSGLMLSDSLWARADPLDTNISNITLAPAAGTIPSDIPAGMWSDMTAEWKDPTIVWGEPRAVVNIQIDPDKIFDGKRVLHFYRAAGASEAGILVRQETNFVANGLFRIGAVFYKPIANANQITVRLRRLSDGVYIYEEVIRSPAAGYWYTFQSAFVNIPDSQDQVYTVEFVLSGDLQDDMYLNDLYCEVANIRYFLRLGDSGAFLHDVTPLAYGDSCSVATTTPVTEFSVETEFLSDRAFAYGGTFTPNFLK